MNPDQATFVLRALRRMAGIPCSEPTMHGTLGIAFLAEPPSLDDVRTLLGDLESKGYVSAITDDFHGRLWTLTPKGTARANQLH